MAEKLTEKQYKNLMEVFDGMAAREFKELFPSNEKKNLDNNIKMGIDGYSISEDASKTVILTEENPNQTIIFKYSKIVPEVNVNINEVPYISTYYIKPVVKLGEEVFIDYYITDYYHKEYLEEDFSERFTVTVRVEGQEDKIYSNLKAGNHVISLGSFSEEGEQKFSILCTDKYGRNSHELFNYFLVRNDVVVNEYVMTEADLITYNIKNTDNYEVKNIVNLSSLATKDSANVTASLQSVADTIIPKSKTYVCIIADTDGDGKPKKWWKENIVKYASDYDKAAILQEATNTRIGLQKLLDDKKEAGYNKVKLLPGTYRIDHQLQIYIPTQFTLDMNGATLKLNPFTGDSNLILDLNNTFDSHVINGTIEGDYFSHDYINSPNNSEWAMGMNISGESKYSSFENLVVKDITGYGGGNGIANSRNGDLGYTYVYPKGIGNTFVLGDIDRYTGLDIDSKNRTTSNFIKIEAYNDIGYLSISRYLGYQGNPCGTWNLIVHFYDENKNFIESIDGYQYRRIAVPTNSKYLRVTILNEAYPTDLSIQYFRLPTHCAFKNVKFENCRAVGLAQAAMKDMLVEDCEFTRSGQTLAKCAYDAEDGWDMMQDVTFKNNKFYNNPNNDFLTCAGHNFIVDGQIDGGVSIWERTRSLVVKNCENIKFGLQSGGKDTIVRHGVYRVYDNTVTGGTVANNLSKNLNCTGTLVGFVSDSTLVGLGNDSNYNRCTININSDFLGHFSKIIMTNCVLNPNPNLTSRYRLSFNGGHLTDNYFENCIFNGKSALSNHNRFYSGTFIDCDFEDTTICPNVNANSDDLISFTNCNFGYSGSNFIYYSPFAYTQGTFSQIAFNNCSIKNLDNNTKSLVYSYAKPNGYCNFNNCTITIPPTLTIFDGYPTNINYITGYTINFNNSPLPSTVKTIGDKYAINTNIKVNII